MKEAELIQLKTERVWIGDLRTDDCYRMAHYGPMPSARVYNSCEFVDSQVEIEDIPIRRIIDHGVEHYIAVTHKVWEYLYYIENPVTAKAQEKKIKTLKDCNYRQYNTIVDFKSNVKKLSEAPLWQRIKWVFSGIK